MRRLVDLVCLLGLVALGGYALDYGDYLSGALILDGLLLGLLLARRWRAAGPTTAARLAALLHTAD